MNDVEARISQIIVRHFGVDEDKIITGGHFPGRHGSRQFWTFSTRRCRSRMRSASRSPKRLRKRSTPSGILSPSSGASGLGLQAAERHRGAGRCRICRAGDQSRSSGPGGKAICAQPPDVCCRPTSAPTRPASSGPGRCGAGRGRPPRSATPPPSHARRPWACAAGWCSTSPATV